MLVRTQTVMRTGDHSRCVTIPSAFARAEELEAGSPVLAGASGPYLIFVRPSRERDLLGLLSRLGRSK